MTSPVVTKNGHVSLYVIKRSTETHLLHREKKHTPINGGSVSFMSRVASVCICDYAKAVYNKFKTHYCV